MDSISRTITVDNRLDELIVIFAALETFADDCAMPDATKHALFLVTEELFVNIVRYGYDDEQQGRVIITAGQTDQGTHVKIIDQARSFDASRPPSKRVGGETLDEMDVGGLGLYLVHEFAQSVRHYRDEAGNVTDVLLRRA